MPRVIALLIVAWVAMAASHAAAGQPEDVVPRALIDAVVAERNGREQARRACADEGELQSRILAGNADAQAEANAAAARGCFGLVSSYSAIPGGVPYGVGVACRPNMRLFGYGRLMLFSVSGSDVPAASVELAEKTGRQLGALWAFGLTYNRVVIARPEFPHRDLCRVAADSYRPGVSEDLPFGEWGYRGLDETDTPVDLSEAARRGTAKALQRLIKARPIDMHVPDVLGLTPLAWATIYSRPEHVRLLLAAGAHPYGEPYWDRPVDTSPITIAREGRQRTMTRLMQPALTARGLTPPAVAPRLDEARSLPELVSRDWRRTYARATLSISAEGRVTQCRFEVAPFGTDLDCEQARRGLIYDPAEDGEGRPETGTVLIDLPVAPKQR